MECVDIQHHGYKMKAAHVVLPLSKYSLIWPLGRHSIEILVGRGNAIFLPKSLSATLKSCLQFMHLAILELKYSDFTYEQSCLFASIYISF